MAATYASFDLGLRHLALCVVAVEEGGEPQIRHWEIINALEERVGGRALTQAKHIRIESAVEAVLDALRARDAVWEPVTHVLIEQQPVGRLPVSNTLMKTLSHCIQSFFHLRGVASIRFVSPKKKLSVAGVDDKAEATKGEKASQRYARHKRAAEVETRRRVAGEWLAWFESQRKKDDAADAFLQAIAMVAEDAGARAKAAERARKAEAAAAKRAAKEEAKRAREAERERKRVAKEEAKREREERKRMKLESRPAAQV